MKITMGNDEFILYLRKNNLGADYDNIYLGKKIWQKIKELDINAIIVKEDMSCLWGDSGNHISPMLLPKTATQFSFDNAILIMLNNFFNELE